MLRRGDTHGNVYVFNLALTSRGPEAYRWLSPLEERTASFTPPPNDVSLGERYLTIGRTERGLIYRLQLPWSELAPVRPSAGVRLGIYCVMFNNNGSGHLDTMHWPVPMDGAWVIPKKWGVLTLQ